MKLKEIVVEGLFNTFRHTISINSDIGITIIIGENGLGKTIIFEMINSFFNSKFENLESIDFKKLIFTFDDGVKWEITKNDEIQKGKENILLVVKNPSNKQQIFDIKSQKRMSMYDRRFLPQNVERIGPDMWKDFRFDDIIDHEMLMARYFNDNNSQTKKYPEWFEERIDANKTYFIQTQRLISIGKGMNPNEKTVDIYSKELADKLKTSLAKSTEESSKLDRTFPYRLLEIIKNRQIENINNTKLTNSLEELEKKRKLLDSVGLIEIDSSTNITPNVSNNEDVVNSVLSLYLEDSNKKLEIFDEVSSKINLLMNIINKRFKHKKLHIDREKGFVFKSKVNIEDNNIIPNNKLSSGEQNELVLFYKLLFNAPKEHLILIDEPEISLHISWQNNFINDLKDIAKINNLKFLIATHSPDIIADNWDLKVELKGLE